MGCAVRVAGGAGWVRGPTLSPLLRTPAPQVHARNKPVRDPELLARVAELAIGYSGAELANLMNEAAILAVSRAVVCIDVTAD